MRGRVMMACGVAAVVVGGLVAGAGAQEQLWIRQFGSSEWDKAFALSPDDEGGMFVAGHTKGDLGGGLAGNTNAWLARYDSAGNQIWIFQLEEAYAWALSPDGAAGVFIAGDDGWLERYDGGGNKLWARQLEVPAGDFVRARALSPDGEGGAFVGGYAFDFSEGYSAWLARYDAAGNRLWIRQLRTADSYAYALTPDGAGGAFVAGSTSGDLGGPNAGRQDAWLALYDSAGNRIWIRQFGTSESDVADALSPDGTGGAFVAGDTAGDLGGANAGARDAWVARYDRTGNQVWIRQFGSIYFEYAEALTPDGAGGAFVAGETWGDLSKPNAGLNDAWVARYDSAGHEMWIRQFGTSDGDAATALLSMSDDVFVAGLTRGDLGGQSAGDWDVFLARWSGDSCPIDMDGDGDADVNDFFGYLDLFAAGDAKADIDGDGDVDVNDFFGYLDLFVAGCG